MEVISSTTSKPIMIARNRVPELFPGLNPKTLANLFSEGRGPKVYRRGRKIFYRVDELESYLMTYPVQTFDSEVINESTK
jgi:hypothetical protein